MVQPPIAVGVSSKAKVSKKWFRGKFPKPATTVLGERHRKEVRRLKRTRRVVVLLVITALIAVIAVMSAAPSAFGDAKAAAVEGKADAKAGKTETKAGGQSTSRSVLKEAGHFSRRPASIFVPAESS